VRRVVGEYVQAAQQQQQAYQQAAQAQFNSWAKQNDDAYEAWASKEVSAEERRLIEREAQAMVKEEFNASDEQVAAAWNSNPMLRSFQGQKFLWEAARARLARRGAAAKKYTPVPTVQRPSSEPIRSPSASDAELSALNKKFQQTGSPKDAAAWLAAKRARRG
jgi:hypothetical protein